MNRRLITLYKKLSDLANREHGQDLVEYALTLSLIAFGATMGMQALANGLNGELNNISSTLGSYVGAFMVERRP